MRAGIGSFLLRKRTFAGDTGSTWKTPRSRGQLANDDESGRAVGELTRDLCRRCSNSITIGGRPDPEHDRAAFGDERETPLRGHDRRRQRLRQRNLVTVCCLVFGAALDDMRVRWCPPAQELALAAVCL